eukprot:5263251-Pyramimonas_sp.AAC.1
MDVTPPLTCISVWISQVQAFFFLLNLCVNQPIPTISTAGVWRFVTAPPRVLYRGLKWLRGEASAEGFPVRVRKARQQRRERNVAKAKELKDLAIAKVRECDSKAAVKLFQVRKLTNTACAGS